MRSLLQRVQSQLSYKIILPYLALTLLVMMAGAAISVGLVAASWEERIQSQLAQVARNSTDALVRRERNQLDFLLLVASAPATKEKPSIADAFEEADPNIVKTVLQSYYNLGVSNSSLDIDRMVAFDINGKTLVDWLRTDIDPTKAPQEINGTDLSQVIYVRQVLSGTLINGNDKFSNLIYFQPDNQPYFFTIAPIKKEAKVVGGVFVAIKVDRLLESLERSSQASVTTLYDLSGTPMGSTLVTRTEIENVRMPTTVIEQLLNGAAQSVYTMGIRNRDYRLFYSPLFIANQQTGYFSVGLSNDFQVRSLSMSRDIVIVIAIFLAAGTVILGYTIARMITRPLTQLVDTAEAVTAGDLERRTNISSQDELGQLAQAFNQMTEYLSRLYRASRDLNSAVHVDAVLDIVSKTAAEVAPGSEAIALLEDRDGLRYHFGPDVSEATQNLQKLHFPPGQSILHDLNSRPGTNLLDIADERLEATGLTHIAGYASIIAAPLMVEEQMAGMLFLGHRDPNAFVGATEPTLKAVVNMAASVLYNALLFDRVQNDASQRRAILESIADGIIVADRNQSVILTNPAAERMLMPFTLSDEKRNINELPMKRIDVGADMFLDRDQQSEHYEYNNRIMRLSRSPVIAQNGSTSGEVIVMHDVSDEVALNHAKTNFIATISHELRSPLTVIMGYSDLLLRGFFGELSTEQRDTLEQVRMRIELMNNIIKNVIMIASIESQNLQTSLEPQEVWLAVEQTVSALQSGFTKKGIQIEVDVAHDLPPIMADGQQLQIILTHLIDNARRYTTTGVVTIRATRDDDYMNIEIIDTGVGIPESEQDLLFTRFHRIEGNSSPERGSGLGLVITRQLVEHQGGRVWVKSNLGSGSIFGFSLPIAHEHASILANTDDSQTTAG